MAEITIRRNGEFMRAAFAILHEHLDGLAAGKIFPLIEKLVQLSEFEKSTYPKRPGIRRFEKIVRFASIPYVKAGWLVKIKGKWSITESGKAAYKIHNDPEEFHRKARALYIEWQNLENLTRDKDEAQFEPDASEGTARITLEEAEEGSWTEIEDYLHGMDTYDFQQLVAGLLRAMGYFVALVSPPGPDKGVDIIAFTDPLGAKPPRIKVQGKRRSDKINVEAIRSFLGVLGDNEVGIYVAAGGFTSEAESEARTQSVKKITLLGLEKLFDLWVQHYENLDQEAKQLLPLKPIYYLSPTE